MAIRRRRDIKDTKRWLFTHPSHLEWWYSKNVRNNPQKKHLINGIINGYSEFGKKVNGVPNDSEQHHNKWKDFAEEMGWNYIPCIRFSHAKGWKTREWLLNPKTHEEVVEKANEWGSIALDMEPYGLGWTWYHRQFESLELDKASRAWQYCTASVAIYPSFITASEIILLNCRDGGNSVPITLDHTTYNGQVFDNIREAIIKRQIYQQRRMPGIELWHGLYLAYLNDRPFLQRICRIPNADNIWFFPRKQDDRENLFTTNWAPQK